MQDINTKLITVSAGSDTDIVGVTGADYVIAQCTASSSLVMKAAASMDGTTFSSIKITNLETGVTTPAGVNLSVAANDWLLFHVSGKSSFRVDNVSGSGTLLCRMWEGSFPDSVIGGVGGAVQCYSFIADGTDELLISASARYVHGVDVFHIDATPVYVKLYDKSTAPSESDTPVHRTGVPANATAALGAGSNKAFPAPIALTNGLGVRAVTGLADNNDSALTTAKVIVNVYYS